VIALALAFDEGTNIVRQSLRHRVQIVSRRRRRHCRKKNHRQDDKFPHDQLINFNPAASDAPRRF
jgi:hypothetical protein